MIRNIFFVLVALVLCVIGAEVALRFHDLSRGQGFVTGQIIKPYRIFGDPVTVVGEKGQLQIRSRHGALFPSDKLSGVVRIVTFGGSTSVNNAVYAEHGFHYSSRLQQRLNAQFPDETFEVIAVANQAYATTHSITQLAFDVLSWDPDIVILSHNFNDLTAAYFPAFLPDYSHKLSNKYYNMTWSKYTCRMSRLCRLIAARLQLLGLTGHDVRHRAYGPEPPALAQEIFERNLRSFVTLARDNGIQIVLGSQPLERIDQADFDHDMAVKPYNDVVIYPPVDEFISHHKRFNTIIETTTRRMGATFVDNDKVFAGDSRYFKDFIHYSKAGVERLAANYETAIIAILDELRPRGGQPNAPGN